MAKVIGCHVIAKGNPANAMQIAPNIIKNGLLVNQAFLGFGVYAYYDNMVPQSQASKPMVVFEVDDSIVIRQPVFLQQHPNYAFMKIVGQPNGYVRVNILGFLNLSGSGLKSYNGTIGVI